MPLDQPRTKTTRPTPDTPADGSSRREQIWKLAYAARTKDDLLELYAQWAESYDADHEAIGFFGHELAASVLARHITRHDTARVLDAGAGTGAAGVALREFGFEDVTGVDLSPDMLRCAEKKGVYTQTLVADLALPVDSLTTSSFDAAILVGVFSYGQAPAEALDEIARLVRPGGVVVFTMRTDFFEEDAMGVRSRMEALADDGVWRLLERTQPAPYLPKKDPDAKFSVWCYRVTGDAHDDPEDGFEEAVQEAFTSGERVVNIDHRWIWDSTASRLYDRYTRSDGYYLTDCEEEILRNDAKDIWNGERHVVELGCGSARKILHVLEAAVSASEGPVRYVPIDVSAGALRATERKVKERFGDRVEVDPRQGLFEDVLHAIESDERKLVFFFGSSIGNLPDVPATVEFLESLRRVLGAKDRLVVGTDLRKDAEVFERAYNEEESCRLFFVHMLRRVNELLGADFDPRVFRLSSTYEREEPFEDVETWCVNLRVAPRVPQNTFVRDLGMEVALEAGQPVQVGISRKFDAKSVEGVARRAGFALERRWLDDKEWFALNELVPTAEGGR
ncbi:MAG: L-histidine N(alpha)-methyltransferase [Planctomycetota bacterium]